MCVCFYKINIFVNVVCGWAIESIFTYCTGWMVDAYCHLGPYNILWYFFKLKTFSSKEYTTQMVSVHYSSVKFRWCMPVEIPTISIYYHTHHPLPHPLPPFPPTPLPQPVLSADPLGPASSLIWPIERAFSRHILSQRRLSFPCRIYFLIRIFQGNDISVNKRKIRLSILLSWVLQIYFQFNWIQNALLSTTTHYRCSIKEHNYISQASLPQVK